MLLVPPYETFNFKPVNGPVESSISNDFERQLGSTKRTASQVNTLIYSMGEDANDIVVSFGLTTEEAKQHNVVNKKFEAHFRGEEKRNV